MRMNEAREESLPPILLGPVLDLLIYRAQRVSSNYLFHPTAARLRFGTKPNGCGWAAAGDQQRWT
jgi:hypothetical protein